MNFTVTLGDYLTRIKAKLSIDRVADNTEWSDQSIIESINDARQEFWDRAKYTRRRGMVTAPTVSDQANITIPETVDTISYLRFNDGSDRTPMHFIPWEAYLSRTITNSSGVPYEWSRQGNEIFTFPAPSETLAAGLEIYGRVGLTELEESDDVDGNIERRWRRMIINYALGELWHKAENTAMASSYYSKFEKQFKDNEYEIVQDQTGQSIPIGAGEVWIDETDERRWGTLT